MKKSYLMIAAAASLLVACQKDDVVTELVNEETEISFSTFTQKATKAENSNKDYTWDLKDHHANFKVWGYKNTSTTPVFGGEEVRWNVTNSAWEYTNNRYWDKAATTYNYYAFAPFNAPFSFNGVDGINTQDKGYFTITSCYNKAGENVSPKNSTNKVESWTKAGAATDVDLMIADVNKLVSPINYDNPVQLNFIHVLSRFNITVNTTDDFYPATGKTDKVKVMNITIGNMLESGTFSENKEGLTAAQLKAGTSTRWDKASAGKTAYSYDFGTEGWEADQDQRYLIETLIIPQETEKSEMHLDGRELTAATPTTDAYIKVTYRIYTTETVYEEFVAYYNLATIFGVADNKTLAFNEGWQNNLNLTIAPGIIKFAAKVAVWDNAENDASHTID